MSLYSSCTCTYREYISIIIHELTNFCPASSALNVPETNDSSLEDTAVKLNSSAPVAYSSYREKKKHN